VLRLVHVSRNGHSSTIFTPCHAGDIGGASALPAAVKNLIVRA
jgi:hypothetical protein